LTTIITSIIGRSDLTLNMIAARALTYQIFSLQLNNNRLEVENGVYPLAKLAVDTVKRKGGFDALRVLCTVDRWRTNWPRQAKAKEKDQSARNQ
jgi:hypothetical protein